MRSSLVSVLNQEQGSGFSGEIIDLGSGTGGLVKKLSQAFPQATVTGIELSFFPYCISKLRRLFFKNKQTHFLYQDIFHADLSDYDVVIAYLLTHINEKLSDRLKVQLKEGCLVICLEYPLPEKDWHVEKQITVDKSLESLMLKEKLYVYRQ